VKAPVTLNVPPGTPIGIAAADAQDFADKADAAVDFQFNSVRCVAIPGGNAGELVERQQRASRCQFVVYSNISNIEVEERDDER